MSKPKILNTRTVARTRLFHVQEVDLEFSNGTQVRYERMKGSKRGAVLIVPMLDDDTVLLIKEYGVGLERYELGFPKGKIDGDEELLDAANRELQEEVGYASKQLQHIQSVTLAPGYIGQTTHIVLARDLFVSTAEGDEPEELEVVPWKLSELDALLLRDDFTEARSLAAMYMVRDILRSG